MKERKVYWFLFLIVGITAGYSYYTQTISEIFWQYSLINLGMICAILLVLKLYANYKMKQSLNSVFGLGDALLFFGLCFAFPTVSFLVFFVFSLLFSLVLHQFLKPTSKEVSVPLAGYMSLFFVGVYLMHWSGYMFNPYTIY